MTYAARAYRGEADLAPVAEFLNMCEAHDQVEEGTSVEELQVEFAEPGFDPALDLRLWEDEAGRLVGFGQLWAPAETADNDGFLWYKVHPQQRGGEIEREMVAWAEARLRARGRVMLRAAARDIEPERSALLEEMGFAPCRYFLRMERPLADAVSAPAFPEGYELCAGPHDPQTWAAMYNESFVDHFNFHPHSADEIRHWQQEPDYRPDLDLVAVGPGGALAAFAWCGINTNENERSGRKDGWISLLGSRRGYRRIGLGRAMLLAGMERLRAAGMDYARLGVDASSPTGATRLYEAVGFTTAYSRTLYNRDIT